MKRQPVEISTIQDLEGLPEGAKLIGADGSCWEYAPYAVDDYTFWGTNGDSWVAADMIPNFGPLTVVWLP